MYLTSSPTLALPLSFYGLAGDVPNVSDPYEMQDTGSPDLVGLMLTVKSKTQANPKGNNEGPIQTIKDCRAGLSVCLLCGF